MMTSHQVERNNKHPGRQTMWKCRFMAKCLVPPPSSWWCLTEPDLTRIMAYTVHTVLCQNFNNMASIFVEHC